jgi:hypothetical protein
MREIDGEPVAEWHLGRKYVVFFACKRHGTFRNDTLVAWGEGH